MDLNLKGKNALVCGSSKGIGRAIAQELARLGANIIVSARTESLLKDLVKELSNDGNQTHSYLTVDFSNQLELTAKIEQLVQQHPIHILINNTGGPPGGLIQQAQANAFLDAFNQHLVCNHLITQAVIPSMKAASYGRIINVISTSVKQPLDGLGVSNTIRGAVANWAKTMANELGQFGVTVNNVLPGATNTQRLSAIIKNKSQKMGLTEEQVAQNMQNAVPAKRFAKPEEVAAAAAFLASPAAAYINGINLPVDGGRTKSL